MRHNSAARDGGAGVGPREFNGYGVMSAAPVWEYKSLLVETGGFVRRGVIDVEEVDALLARHGRSGWELVAVVPVSDGAVGTARLLYTFKRPGPAAAAR